MRKLFKLALVVLGIAAFMHWRNRRKQEASEPWSVAADPADDLRRKLAESREDEPAEPTTTPEESVEERRAEVHHQGRSALEEMTSSEDG